MTIEKRQNSGYLLHMIKAAFVTTSTLFWLVMTSLLIQREYFQLTGLQSQYEILPLESGETRAEYHAILMGSERIGFNYNVLKPNKNPKHPDTFLLKHTTFLSFLFLGQKREMLIRGKARLNNQLFMEKFKVHISSGDYTTLLKGFARKGKLYIQIASSQEALQRKAYPLDHPVFYSESTDFIWTPENLKLGKQGRFDIFNPILLGLQKMEFAVREKSTLTENGKTTDVYVVHLTSNGIETRSWVSPKGVVLRAESPTGLSLKKEEGWQIFDAMRERKGAPPDLPNLFSIPSDIEIKDPFNLVFLKVKLKLPDQEKEVSIQKSSLDGLEKVPFPVPLPKETDFSRYLESTAWVQSNDPVIKTAAQNAVEGSKTAADALNRLVYWVHYNVAPVPTLSFPNAREVLQIRKGDCNEYTALFTALARSLGMPTRMIAGIVYQNGRFFYHAWPEVYIGRWIVTDPTFGQVVADATHIPLLEGNLEEQIALVNQVGKIRVSVIETRNG